jgi:ribonucleoside-diphosphate reductase alpha chain
MNVGSAIRAARVSHREKHTPQQNELSHRVWEARYRYAPATDAVPERSLAETWDRVAQTLASVEPTQRAAWRRAFRKALDDFKFLPAGRILAGAGAATTATLANCFAAGELENSIEPIFDRLKECALTTQWGGGVGCDFTPIEPRSPRSPGPVSYLRLWDAMGESVSASGARRGAMMGTLRCDHPDIEEFIEAKRDGSALRNFNLSVLVTDAFMEALAAGRNWPLGFPCAARAATSPGLRPSVSGGPSRAIARLVSARELWEKIAAAAHAAAEPGVLFIDRINRSNNLYYAEQISATNPCGEVPLPPHGACMLGSLNLAAFVREPFSVGAKLDFAALEALVPTAVRMLDDAVDLSAYPLDRQAEQARATRRIGLGVTGLADALIMLGLHYDSDEGRDLARTVLQRVRDAAYCASTDLAEQKGAFPLFDRDAYLAGEHARSLPDGARDRIARRGLRNSHLLAIAPAGTISLLANNVSSGIEPVFAPEGERRLVNDQGIVETHVVRDYAYALWSAAHTGSLPSAFVTAGELEPEDHLAMLAVLQPFVDSSISKTLNLLEDTPPGAVGQIFERAYALGAKGCTVFRPNAVTGSVLERSGRCCRP